MKKILLIHGLNGSGANSRTGQTLKKVFGDLVYTPDMPINPVNWPSYISKYLKSEFTNEKIIIVGNSTGGLFASFYAHKYGYDLVLINPVIDPNDLRQFVGENKNFVSGEEWYLGDDDLDALLQYEVKNPSLQALVYLGRYDAVLDHRKVAKRYEASRVVITDNDHSYRLSDADLLLLSAL